MSATLSIRNWERFQHYKDRDPPWVKLYRDLLTSESWVLGTDLSRVVQVASTLLAPRYSNQIPMRFDLLKRVMSLDCKPAEFDKAIEHLVATGFLEIQQVPSDPKVLEHFASTSLATCTSETEQKRAEQSRAEERKSAQARARPSNTCPEDFEITDERRAWAQEECPGVDVELQTKLFREHEFKDPHTDWGRVWKKWMRRSPEFQPRLNGHAKPRRPYRDAPTTAELEALEAARAGK